MSCATEQIFNKYLMTKDFTKTILSFNIWYDIFDKNEIVRI